MTIRPRRSVLYMPGSNARALEKARTLAADAVILDLEDAVAPDAKAVARQQVADAVKAGGFGSREVVIRVNGHATPWYKEDVAAAAAAGPDAILVPKVQTPGDVMRFAKDIREAGAPEHTKLWAMMETPLAILNADAIARTAADPASRLTVFIMGTNDIAKETRARLIPGRLPMAAYLSICVAAARAHGVEIIDGVYNDFSNEAGLREECEQGRDFGMDGKTLIHPSQVDGANRAFSATPEAIADAQLIVDAFAQPEHAGAGVINLQGRMVERLHLAQAERLLAIDKAIAERLAGRV